MSALSKFDSEDLQFAAGQIIIDNFNQKLTDIIGDKSKNVNSYTLNPPLGMLGANLSATSGLADNPALAVDVLSTNRQAFNYDPFIWVQFLNEKSLSEKGEHSVELALCVAVTDIKDGSGEVRIARYTRALKELFSPKYGSKIGIVPVSGLAVLPTLPAPKFENSTERRLTGGLKINLSW